MLPLYSDQDKGRLPRRKATHTLDLVSKMIEIPELARSRLLNVRWEWSRQGYDVKDRGDTMNRTGSEADTGSNPALNTHPPAGVAQTPQLLRRSPLIHKARPLHLPWRLGHRDSQQCGKVTGILPGTKKDSINKKVHFCVHVQRFIILRCLKNIERNRLSRNTDMLKISVMWLLCLWISPNRPKWREINCTWEQ